MRLCQDEGDATFFCEDNSSKGTVVWGRGKRLKAIGNGTLA